MTRQAVTTLSRGGWWSRRDRGSATVLGIFLVVVVIVLAGVVVQAGVAMDARGHAVGVAQQAARAGANQLDLTVLREQLRLQLDPAAAQAAATAYLAQVGETGTVIATTEQVTVTVTVTRPGVLAGLIGRDEITVTGTANAEPVPA